MPDWGWLGTPKGAAFFSQVSRIWTYMPMPPIHDGNIAGQLGHTLLEILLVVVAGRFFDLATGNYAIIREHPPTAMLSARDSCIRAIAMSRIARESPSDFHEQRLLKICFGFQKAAIEQIDFVCHRARRGHAGAQAFHLPQQVLSLFVQQVVIRATA
jgi:hypothetical protein